MFYSLIGMIDQKITTYSDNNGANNKGFSQESQCRQDLSKTFYRQEQNQVFNNWREFTKRVDKYKRRDSKGIFIEWWKRFQKNLL